MIGFPRRASLAGQTPAEAASYWLVRFDQGEMSRAELAQFESWRSAAPAHADAFARAQHIWDGLDGLVDPHLNALREVALDAAPEPRRGWWPGVGAGVAASVAAVALVGSLFLLTNGARAPVQQEVARASPVAVAPTGFETRRGERRTVRLEDGSTVTMNTATAIRVDFSKRERLIRLIRGQALFEVAKNPTRPFVVRAADRQVTALGTVFQVRLDRNRLKVTLVEGKVVVDGVADRPRAGLPAIVPTVLTPGEELVATLGARPKLDKVDIEQGLRWREGFVEFEDEPLANAVREMNRYTSRRLVIADPKLAELRVSGVFRTGNAERFAAILGELLPVTAQEADGDIELVSRPAP